MRKLSFFLLIFLTGLVLFALFSPVDFFQRARNEVWAQGGISLISGRIEEAGTYFEIKDSEYLNISLKSNQEIEVVLESIPKMISLNIEVSSSFVAELTIESLEPNKTYYKYEDSHKNEAVFISDTIGTYSWTQDLTQPHHIWFQEAKGTIFIPEDCSTYGTWNATTSTCTLTQDLTESVEITTNNITLNCSNHNIAGADTDYGIYAIDKNGVTIKNCNVTHFSYGILLYASDNTLIDNNAFYNYYGIGLGSLNNAFRNTTLNNRVGISLSGSSTRLDSNIISNNHLGIFLYSASGHVIVNNTVSNNKQGIDLSYSSTGNEVTGNQVYLNDYYGILLRYGSNYNLIASNNIDSNGLEFVPGYQNLSGIYLYSSYNTIKDNKISDNYNGIWLYNAYDNKIYHNNFISNSYQIYLYSGTGNLFDNGYPSGGNYWSDYDDAGEGCIDANTDNICDSPYFFTGGQDNYPFMQENGWEAPPIPTYNVAVILAEPLNIPHNSTPKTYQPCKLLSLKHYDDGHSEEYYYDLAYCVADYHKENSFGTVNLDFEIFDNNGNWFKTSRNEEDYLGNEHEFVIEAINLAISTGIDLTSKDIVIALHSGEAVKKKEDVGKKLITQTWGLVSQPLGYPPYKIIVAEDDLTGAWAHEIGHIIGALIAPENTIIPDLSNNVLLMGFVEKWDLMARGSRNDDGKNPPYMSSYTKEFLQWLNYDIYPKSAYGEYWINSLETSQFGGDVLRYNLSEDVNDESPKYYILEARNRNLKTWDSSLPGLPIVGDKHLVLYQVDTKGLNEYGYVPEGTTGYQEGMMWNQYRTVTIPGNNPEEYFEIKDGVLNPIINETYRDLDNLVKFTALTDRAINDQYEIKAGIKEITHDSFGNRFRGVILRPSSLLKQKVKTNSIWNPVKTAKIYKDTLTETQLAVSWFNPKTEKWEGGAPLAISNSYITAILQDVKISDLQVPGFRIENYLILKLEVLKSSPVKGTEYFIGKDIEGKTINVLVEESTVNFWSFKKGDKVQAIIATGIITAGEKGSPGYAPYYTGTIYKSTLKYLLCFVMFFFVLILVFSVRVFIKIFLHWKIGGFRRVLKVAFLTLLIIFISILLLLFLLSVYFVFVFPHYLFYLSELSATSFNIVQVTTAPLISNSNPLLEPMTTPDLDLHLYCENGNHIGINYETEEYEIQIAEAIVSGDNQNIPEWILIPENITDCHFVVSSYDNQKFLEENPEIAQEIEDTTDGYEIYARYIDPATDIYTSQILTNQSINPDQNIIHQTHGTTTISVTEGVVYNFSGFLPPIKTDGSGVYKLGRTLPIKFQLTDVNNNYILTATAELSIAKISNGVVGSDEIPLSTFAADTGNIFRYDIEDNQYIYNFSTDTLSAGSWQLKVALDDGKNYTVTISAR